MEKTKMSIKWRAYKNDNNFKEIFDYITSIKENEIYVKLDPDDYEFHTDVILDKLNISKIEFNELSDYEFELSFNADYKSKINILRLIKEIKKTGDGGHSFDININRKTFYWDGDGDDYISEVNGKEIKSNIDSSEFSKYLKINENMKKELKLTESELNSLITESVKQVISELDWRTLTNAYEKSKERASKEKDPYKKSIYNDQTTNFRREAGKRMNSQYGLTNKDMYKAKKYANSYDSKKGTYDNSLDKPSRKTLSSMSRMMKDKDDFFQKKSKYDKEQGKWVNKK